MNKLKKKYNSDFVVLPEKIFRDTRLSYKEKGLMLQIISLSNDQEINASTLVMLSKDNCSSVKASLFALEKYGYITRVQSKSEREKITNSDYFIYDDSEENEVFVTKAVNQKCNRQKDQNEVHICRG